MEDCIFEALKSRLIFEPQYVALKMMLDICRAIALADSNLTGKCRYTDKIIAIAIEDWRRKEGKKNRVTKSFILKNAKKIAQFIRTEEEFGQLIYEPATFFWMSEEMFYDTDWAKNALELYNFIYE